jgi:glycosyltransferase involved in cell wall biosynthesis
MQAESSQSSPGGDHKNQPAKKRIAILLSTFNGAKWLQDLLNSLDAQKFTGWDLWVRDDGSTDGSPGIIRRYEEHLRLKEPGKQINFTEGKNIGVIRSYFELLDAAGDDYDGYAFSDQDDIWLPAKLERAAGSLSDSVSSTDPFRPILYHTRQWITNVDGKRTARSPMPRHIGFENALVQNQIVGCTMVINGAMRKIILDGLQRIPEGMENQEKIPANIQSGLLTSEAAMENIIMHDWWCYLAGAAFGNVVYDPEPTVLFRRHAHNRTPAGASRFRQWAGRAVAMRKRSWRIHHIIEQAALFRLIYGSHGLSTCQIKRLDRLLSLKHAGVAERMQIIRTGQYKRSGRIENLLFRLMVMLNRF